MVQLNDAGRLPNLHQLAASFCLFALLFAVSVFGGFLQTELGSVEIARSVHFIWTSLILVTPALMLYVWQVGRQPLGNTWRLLWTFSFLLYLGHFYYSYFIIFQADFFMVLEEQTVVIGLANFILTLVWLVDVVLSWLIRTYHVFVFRLRLLAHIWVAVSFYVAAIVFSSGTVQFIAMISAALVVSLLIWRLLVWRLDTKRQQCANGMEDGLYEAET